MTGAVILHLVVRKDFSEEVIFERNMNEVMNRVRMGSTCISGGLMFQRERKPGVQTT